MSFSEIFNPGMRYLREERERRRMQVSKPTHGGGAPLGIDLDSGTAKITLPPKSPDPNDSQQGPVPETPNPAEPAAPETP